MKDPSASGPEIRGKGGGAHLDEDRCLDLLAGYLPAAEQDGILAHLAGCPACEELFRQRAAERERLRAMAPEPIRERPSPAPFRAVESAALSAPSPWGRLRRWLSPGPGLGMAIGGATAAAIAMVVILSRPWGGSTEDPAQLLRWLPPPAEIVQLRGAAGGQDAQVLDGIAAYTRRDLVTARQHLMTASASGPMETLRKIYLGSILVRSGEYREAESLLAGPELDGVPEPMKSEARWSLYVAWIGAGRRTSADSLLRILCGAPGEIGECARQVSSPR